MNRQDGRALGVMFLSLEQAKEDVARAYAEGSARIMRSSKRLGVYGRVRVRASLYLASLTHECPWLRNIGPNPCYKELGIHSSSLHTATCYTHATS